MSLRLGTAFVAGGGSTVNVDNSTIIKDANNVISAQALLNQNTGNNPVKLWIGTKAEYDAIGTYDATTLYHITDSGGTEGTTDYNDLSNQPQINDVTLAGNKTSSDLGLMSNANFLPDGYTINLKADGTGDFETIQEAINFLNGKYCPGIVTINLEAGTYNVSSQLAIGNLRTGVSFNFECLEIVGTSVNSTNINSSNTALYQGIFAIFGGNVRIRNLTVQYASKQNSTYGVLIQSFGRAYLDHIKIANCAQGVQTNRCSNIARLEGLTIDNVDIAICAGEGGYITFHKAATFTVSNAITAVQVASGGIISLANTPRTFTNVTNQTSQTIGTTMTNDLIIEKIGKLITK